MRHETFNFDAWDSPAIPQVLTAIVTTVAPARRSTSSSMLPNEHPGRSGFC